MPKLTFRSRRQSTRSKRVSGHGYERFWGVPCNNGHEAAPRKSPALFSKPFAELLAVAVGRAGVSRRRAVSLYGLTVDDLEDLFAIRGA